MSWCTTARRTQRPTDSSDLPKSTATSGTVRSPQRSTATTSPSNSGGCSFGIAKSFPSASSLVTDVHPTCSNPNRASMCQRWGCAALHCHRIGVGSAPPGRLDRRDVDLLHRQHGLEGPAAKVRASASQESTNSRLVVRAAPRRSSSTWMPPTPPPISNTLAPCTPSPALRATARVAVSSKPALDMTPRESRPEDFVVPVPTAAVTHNGSIHPLLQHAVDLSCCVAPRHPARPARRPRDVRRPRRAAEGYVWIASRRASDEGLDRIWWCHRNRLPVTYLAPGRLKSNLRAR